MLKGAISRRALAGLLTAGLGGLAGGRSARARPRRLPLLEDVCVAGDAYYQIREAWTELHPGRPLRLRREFENRYDQRAIEVLSARGVKLGYVPRVQNEALARLMDAGAPLGAEIAARREHRVPGGPLGSVTIRFRVWLEA